MASTQLHAVLLPPPGFAGHLIPFIELAKKLLLDHSCHVTLVIPDDMKPHASLLPSTIDHLFLPPVPTDDLPADMHAEALLPIRLLRSLPSLRHAMASLPTPPTALVLDLFTPYAIDVARELGIPAYIFYVIAANELALSLDLPDLDSACSSQFVNPIRLPGNVALLPEDFPDCMKDRSSPDYKSGLDLCKKYFSADGIIVNSFFELESEAFRELKLRGVPPVHAVGPLIRRDARVGSECQKWLDDQPPDSVLYVSFGSGGSLSKEQLGELALGLEMSQQRFLWVVRSCSENAAAEYLNAGGEKDDPLKSLPQGFLERTQGRSFVVDSWAPQVEVLSHGSTGGFLMHCGWNSVLGSSVFGVPSIAWPLCFEQKMNAVVLADGLKTAIRVRANENGVVERGHIAEVVKELMEGEQGRRIRDKMMQLKLAAAHALSPEGSSTKALANVVQTWTNAN